MKINPLKECVLFILGLFIGLLVLVLFPYNSEVSDIIGYFIKIRSINIVNITEYNWVIKTAALIVVLIAGILITRFLHLFANSKNVDRLSVVIGIFVFIFISIPVSYIIISMYAPYIYYSSGSALLFILVYAVSYYLIMRLILYIFSSSYKKMLNKPFKNCRLCICEVTSNTEYDVVKVLAKRHTYEQCYTLLTNYTGDIGSKQFYQIQEMSVTGKKVIDHWNYHSNKDVMSGNEEDFLTRIYSKEFAKDISWGL
ncbi:MAG: hypothetical protein J5517_07915 [Eubacterium sp.]|nr:hypothetical protein [Eubacterium sp.]